jgi:hypothetical protein
MRLLCKTCQLHGSSLVPGICPVQIDGGSEACCANKSVVLELKRCIPRATCQGMLP